MGLFKEFNNENIIPTLSYLVSSHIRIDMAASSISYSYVGTNEKFNITL